MALKVQGQQAWNPENEENARLQREARLDPAALSIFIQ